MNEQEKLQNLRAVRRIEDKINDIHKDIKVQRWLLLLIIATVTICGAINLLYAKMSVEAISGDYSRASAQVEESVDESGQATLSPADRLLVAKICMAETNTYDGYIAVAQTIHDRAALWGQEVYEVATADKQFAAPYNGKASEEALKAVDAVFGGERAFDSNVTHFYSGNAPYWAEHKEYVGSRGGNHFFNSKY